MERAKIREDVDPESKAYRKSLIRVVFIVLGLGLVGGTWLGLKISHAERANQERAESHQSQSTTGHAPVTPAEKHNRGAGSP